VEKKWGCIGVSETITCRLKDARLRGYITQPEYQKYLDKGVTPTERITVAVKGGAAQGQPASSKPRKIVKGGEA